MHLSVMCHRGARESGLVFAPEAAFVFVTPFKKSFFI